MGKTQSCRNGGLDLKRGPWTPEEDQKLFAYIEKNGHSNWSTLPQKAGLRRCGKSCRIRWINYLRPDIKRGKFTPEEEQTIIQLHALLGNRWSIIAAFLNNRTDNEIKNYWNCRLKKRLAKMGIDPSTHRRKTPSSNGKNVARIIHMAQWESTRLEAEARLVRKSKLENRTLNSLESEILSNLKAMPHLYAARSLASKPPCLDILKAWEIVAGACASLDTYISNNKPQKHYSSMENDVAVTKLPAAAISDHQSDLETSFPSGCMYHAPEPRLSDETKTIFDDNNDKWGVDEAMDVGNQVTCFDDLWDLLACDSDEGKLLKDEAGIFAIDDGGARAGEELLIGYSLSYCGRLGSLLMH